MDSTLAHANFGSLHTTKVKRYFLWNSKKAAIKFFKSKGRVPSLNHASRSRCVCKSVSVNRWRSMTLSSSHTVSVISLILFDFLLCSDRYGNCLFFAFFSFIPVFLFLFTSFIIGHLFSSSSIIIILDVMFYFAFQTKHIHSYDLWSSFGYYDHQPR
jgi:hypothetical protein